MNLIENVIKSCLIFGLVMLLGRIVTAFCRYYDIEFLTFFTDYQIVSIVILIIGIVGTEIINFRKRREEFKCRIGQRA